MKRKKTITAKAHNCTVTVVAEIESDDSNPNMREWQIHDLTGKIMNAIAETSDLQAHLCDMKVTT